MRQKEVYTITELMKMGFPERVIREVSRSENFYEIGFHSGKTAYFFLDKLKKELERREMQRC